MELHRQIFWSPAAQTDLNDIWSDLHRVASPEVADALLREIHAAASRLIDFDPRMYRVRSDLVPEAAGALRVVPVHPYGIFFRFDPLASPIGGDIEIIRVLHLRRNLPSLLLGERS